MGMGFPIPMKYPMAPTPSLPPLSAMSPPIGLTSLSPLQVEENQPVDTHVGKVQGLDPNDPQGTGPYLYTFVDGNGSRDNQLFNLAPDGGAIHGHRF